METCLKRRADIGNIKSYLLLLLLHLLQLQVSFLILATFVLEPYADDARTQPGHLRQLLLHQRVRSRVGVVTRP